MLLIWPIYYFILKRNAHRVSYSLKEPLIRDIKDFVVCSGVILPKEEVEIKSRVSGLLEEIYVKNGDSVHKNQIIAKIKIIPDIGQLSLSESKINVAKINFENQKAIYIRNKSLLEKGIIAKSEFETIETNFLNAKERLNSANREYRIIKSGDPSGGKKSNTSITSTINGIVILLPAKIGSSVIHSNNFNDGTTIAKIANVDEMIFEGNVKEYEVSKLQIGMPVLINTAISDIKEEGFLSEISSSGKNIDGMILFEIKSKLVASKIKKTGFSASAKIVIQENRNVLCVNEGWVKFSNDSTYLYIHENDDNFEKRSIILGISDGIYTEVLSGIKEGEVIRVYDK